MIALLLAACGLEPTPVDAPLPEIAVLSPVSGQLVRPGAAFTVRLHHRVFAPGDATLATTGLGDATAIVHGEGDLAIEVTTPDEPGPSEVAFTLTDAEGDARTVRVPVEIAARPALVPDTCIPPEWAFPESPYRKPLWVRAWGAQINRPVSFDVDFAAELAALGGDPEDFDPASIAVVEYDCAGPTAGVRLPVQWSDTLVSLFDKRDHQDPAGDLRGSVTFQPTRPATVTSGALVRWYAVYFGGPAEPPLGTDLSTSPYAAVNSRVTLSFSTVMGHGVTRFTARRVRRRDRRWIVLRKRRADLAARP